MADWSWETTTRQKMTGSSRGIKKLPEEWVWEPVRMGPAHTSYGRGIVGKVLTDSVYDCGFCRGTGERPRGSKCPVCKGKGIIEIQPPVVMCACCRGRGEDKPRSLITCSACRGKGVLSVTEPIEICTHCNERGREPTNKLVCGACRGSGVITSSIKVENRNEGLGYGGHSESGESDEHLAWIQPPSGSERQALEIILDKGRAGRCTVGKNMAVGSTYAEMVCNQLAKKGLVRMGESRHYYPTPKGKKALGYREEGHDYE